MRTHDDVVKAVTKDPSARPGPVHTPSLPRLLCLLDNTIRVPSVLCTVTPRQHSEQLGRLRETSDVLTERTGGRFSVMSVTCSH
jgi:hypothetical protein